MKKDSVKKETWKEWEQTCEKLKKYETTLKRVVLTTDKKLLYQAEYNRKIRAAQVINDTLTAYIVGEDDYSRKNEKVMVWLARFKHVDVVDSAVNLDKLRGIGFSYDEIRAMVGYPLLNTEFSNARALTKNYGEEGDNGTSIKSD